MLGLPLRRAETGAPENGHPARKHLKRKHPDLFGRGASCCG